MMLDCYGNRLVIGMRYCVVTADRGWPYRILGSLYRDFKLIGFDRSNIVLDGEIHRRIPMLANNVMYVPIN